MDAASEVKQCFSSLKSIEASLAALAVLSKKEKSKKMLREAVLEVSETALNVQKRMGELERESKRA